MPERSDRRRQALLLGLGFDGTDGHKRLTQGRDFVVAGGSKDTHEEMQEKAIRFDEELRRRGKCLGEVSSPEELRDIADRAGM